MDTHWGKKLEISQRTKARGPTNFHTSMTTYCPPQWHLANSRSKKGSSDCRNADNNIG